jgi:hypothetical protein
MKKSRLFIFCLLMAFGFCTVGLGASLSVYDQWFGWRVYRFFYEHQPPTKPMPKQE